MAKFGSLPSTEALPAAQFANCGVWSNVIANNTQLTFEFGRFTMPWAGNLFATFYASASFTGYQQLQLNPVTCSPTPDDAPIGFSITQNSQTDFHTVMAWAGWALNPGALVIATCTFQVGNGGPNVTGDQFAVNFRTART
jgi:hypothetical protein